MATQAKQTLKRTRRLAKERRDLVEAGFHVIETAIPQGKTCAARWKIQVPPLRDTWYAGFDITAIFEFPAAYPFKAPSMLLPNLWHPNVAVTGQVCMNVIQPSGSGDGWSLSTTLLSLLQVYLPQFLDAPNPDDGYNEVASNEWQAIQEQQPHDEKRRRKAWRAILRRHMVREGCVVGPQKRGADTASPAPNRRRRVSTTGPGMPAQGN